MLFKLCRKSSLLTSTYLNNVRISQLLLRPYFIKDTLNVSSQPYSVSCTSKHYSTHLSTEDEFKSEHLSLKDVYENRVKAGEITLDNHQIEVINELNRLADELVHYRPPSNADTRFGLLKNMSGTFFKWTSQYSAKPKINKPKGVYIWGTVGGGKTMLMDLFYDTINVVGENGENVKRRTHFHDFMQEVHVLIHESKKKAPPRDMSGTNWEKPQPYDPIPAVGDAILQRSWILCLDEFQVTDIADAMILRHLFAYLFSHGLVLVSTSNRPPSELYKNGLQRSAFLPFIDLLYAKCNSISLDPGIDYRRKLLGGAEQLYFYISDSPTIDDETSEGPTTRASADAAMDVMFKFMAATETDALVRPLTGNWC